jgi:hypothetical protein
MHCSDRGTRKLPADPLLESQSVRESRDEDKQQAHDLAYNNRCFGFNHSDNAHSAA